MSNLPGVGLFGCNEKSEFLVKCLKQNGFDVKAIWSNNLQQANEFSKRLDIDFYTNEIDVLLLRKDVEIVLIFCLQDNFVQIVSKAFTIGKHVLCDLPSNLTSKEINEMCQAASYYPSLISIFSFPLRYLPQFKIMRNLILDQKFIGEINLINVEINGRNLIEIDNFKNFLVNKTNCNVCNLADKFENSNENSFINKIGLKKNQKYNDEEMNKKNLIKNENFSKINQINKNQNYIDSMRNGGLLNNLGPHVIDIITYLTDLKAKKVNGILRTFNSSAFINELSLIKRITVDDFCTFQMEMYKPPSILKINNQNDRDQNVDKNLDQNEQKKVNEKNQKFLTINRKVKELSNNKPIALINLNDHLKIKDKSYEFIIGGEFGYLRLKDGDLFTYQYEQNNNQLINDKFNSNLIEEKLIYSIKDDLEKNFCILHQDLENSKLLMLNQNKNQFEVGLEKLVESIKNAFSKDESLKTKNKQLNENLNKNLTEKIKNTEEKQKIETNLNKENEKSKNNKETKLINGNSKSINDENIQILNEKFKINNGFKLNGNTKVIKNTEMNDDCDKKEVCKKELIVNKDSIKNEESKLNGNTKMIPENANVLNEKSEIIKLDNKIINSEQILLNGESKINGKLKLEEDLIEEDFKVKINIQKEDLVDNLNNNLLEINLNKNLNYEILTKVKNKENLKENEEYFKDTKNKINERLNKCIILPLKEKISQVNSFDTSKINSNNLKNEKKNLKTNAVVFEKVSNNQNLNKNLQKLDDKIDLKLNNQIIEINNKNLKENNQNLMEQKLIKTTIDVKNQSNNLNLKIILNNENNQNLDKTKNNSTKVWFKEAVSLAGNFEDGKYVQNVIEAIRLSSKNYEWTRVFHNLVIKKN